MLFLAGDCQSVGPEGHYVLGEAYVKVFSLLGVKRIYTLGGYGVGRLVENPRVLSGLSHASLREAVVEAGAVSNGIEPVGGIIGAAGLLITCGRRAGMEGVALLGETSGYLVDPVSSTAVLDVLEKTHRLYRRQNRAFEACRGDAGGPFRVYFVDSAELRR